MDNKLLKITTILCGGIMFPGVLLADNNPIGDGDGVVTTSKNVNFTDRRTGEEASIHKETKYTTDGSSMTKSEEYRPGKSLNTGVSEHEDNKTWSYSQTGVAGGAVDIDVVVDDTKLTKEITVTPPEDFSVGEAKQRNMVSTRVQDTLSTATPLRNTAIRNK